MKKLIDLRKKYLAVVDTETANGIKEGEKINLQFSLVYDFGTLSVTLQETF